MQLGWVWQTAGALKLAQISLTGSHHRGIDDANNMIKLMPYVMGRVFIDSQKEILKIENNNITMRPIHHS